MKKRVLLTGAAAILTASGGVAAFAQESPTTRGALGAAGDAYSNFQRDRSVSVRQRPHEGYEALGLRAGAFMVWPKLSVTGEYNDNIFATAVDEEKDFVWRVQPELNITSTWSRHALTAYARGSINRFTDFETENTEDYSVGALGRLDILRTFQVNGGADFSRQTEPRTSSSSPVASAEPIQFEVGSAFLNVSREFNRLRLSGRADWREFDYLNGRTAGGAPVFQNDRDRTVTTLTGRADYAISPDTAVFVSVAANDRDYRLSNPPATQFPNFVNRDSEGVEALVGANFELTAVVRGELGVGYLRQKFDDAAFRDIEGFGARGQVEWFPTQLTTLTFTGSRTVEDSGIVASSAFLSSNVGLQVDHELLRNVILSGNVGYGEDDYRGIDRKDERLTAGVSATYLLNRNIGVTVGASRFKQTSAGANAGFDFDVNRVGATLTLQY